MNVIVLMLSTGMYENLSQAFLFQKVAAGNLNKSPTGSITKRNEENEFRSRNEFALS